MARACVTFEGGLLGAGEGTMKLEPWMWAVLSHAILIRLTLPDPPPDLLVDASIMQQLDLVTEGGDISVSDRSLLAAMDLLASGLTEEKTAEAVRGVIRDAFAGIEARTSQ
jgi:hypothetical protein